MSCQPCYPLPKEVLSNCSFRNSSQILTFWRVKLYFYRFGRLQHMGKGFEGSSTVRKFNRSTGTRSYQLELSLQEKCMAPWCLEIETMLCRWPSQKHCQENQLRNAQWVISQVMSFMALHQLPIQVLIHDVKMQVNVWITRNNSTWSTLSVHNKDIISEKCWWAEAHCDGHFHSVATACWSYHVRPYKIIHTSSELILSDHFLFIL